MFESAVKHVFISYVREDEEVVAELRKALKVGGIRVWTDHDLKPGDFWENVIREKIRDAGFLVACFSHASAARPASYMQRELDAAVKALGAPSAERPWFIPVLLSDMAIPAIDVGGVPLKTVDIVHLHREWDDGIQAIRDQVLQRDPPVLDTVQPAYVFVSDVHTTLHPLTRPGELPTVRGMLANTEAYGHFYRQQQCIRGRHFDLRPLSRDELDENHFWNRVANLDAPELAGPPAPIRRLPAGDGAPAAPLTSPWHRQLPIVCEPRKLRLEVDPVLGPGAKARCFVLLWPAGWSSSLEIDLPGRTKADTITELVAGLRSRRSARHARSSLLCNGERVNASGLFRLLAGWMHDELGLAPGQDTCVVPGNVVLGVADTWRQTASYSRLPSDTRAGIHQLLRGARLQPHELDDIEGRDGQHRRKFLYTKLRRYNYVVTVFGRGSVVVASDGWGNDVTDEERMDAGVMRCLTSNVRFATVQTLMLAYFASAARNTGWLEGAPLLRPLVEAAGRELLLLKADGSRFEKSFCCAHTTIVGAMPNEQPPQLANA